MKDWEQLFRKYLNRLSPLASEVRVGARHKAAVRSCLKNNFECYSLLETGSLGNGTGVRHYSDTDYFAVIPDRNLGANSATQLRKVKDALRYTFWRTASGIKVNSPSVVIPFGKYRSENLEVTPCLFGGVEKTSLGGKKTFWIPNGEGDWTNSSPQAHKAYVARCDRRLKKRLKPLITLVKSWKFERGVPISSFYLELRIAKLFADRKRIDYTVDVLSVLNYLYDRELAKVQDPMRISGLVSPCSTAEKLRSALSKLETARSRAHKAAYYRDRDPEQSIYWLRMLFGNFPSR